MIKKGLKIVFLIMVLNIIGITSIKAQNIEFQPDDIIIGNTIFRSEVTITATRASKAGALYSKISGDTDVKVYQYNIMGKWRIYDSETDLYVPVKDQGELETALNSIYYNNNVPIAHSYDGTKMIEYLEWGLDNLVISDSNVSVDIENKKVTCPYGTEFTFKYEFGGGTGTSPIKVKCGFDGNLIIEETHLNTPLSLKDVIASEENDYLNQNKVTLTKVDDTSINLKVNEKLEEFDSSYDKGTYYAFDLLFDDTNNAKDYVIYSNAYFVRDYDVENNKVRLLVSLDMYKELDEFYFIVLDNEFNEHIVINLDVDGINKISNNLDIASVTKVDANKNSNNNSIGDITYENGDLNVELIGPLTSIEHNGIEYDWITLEFNFEDIFDLNHLNIEYINTKEIDYEITNNKLTMWINVDDLSDLNIKFDYPLTSGENEKHVDIIFEDNYVTYEWADSISAAYQQKFNILDRNGNRVSGIVNVSYKDSDYSEDIFISEDGKYLIPSLITINSVSKIEEGE